MESGNWGNCSKCGSALDMHYVKWCPSCEPPHPKMRKVFDFFKTARYIARQEGYDQRNYKPGDWVHLLTEQMEYPGNDSFIEITPGMPELYPEGSEMREYCDGLVKHFDINDKETILLEISW